MSSTATSISLDTPLRRGRNAQQSLIVVAVLTYQRPQLLSRLLDEFSRLALPTQASVVLLVIDNDADGSAESIVDSWRSRISNVHYLVESRRGIPVARNRAIAAADYLGADALCFLDDDEFPDRNWLFQIVEHWQDTGANLIGGPVYVAPTDPGKSRWQRLVNRCLTARAAKKNREVIRAVEQGKRYTIVTNNWLCDLNWLRRVGIRFDEQRLVSGGSDAVFFHEAMGLGCTTSWCPTAIVHETMTDERLCFRYHFSRAAAQSINHFQKKKPPTSVVAVITVLLVATARASLGFGLLIVPIFGMASPLIAVRSIGWSVGRIRVLQGKQSTLYA